MKLLSLCIFLFFCIISNAQNVHRDRESFRGEVPAPIVQELKEPVDIKKQIELFVNQTNTNTSGSKLPILYTIKVYEYDTITHDYCFSMIFIINSLQFYPGLFTHYFMIGDYAVVINASNQNIKSIFSTCDIISIEKEDINMLISHLVPPHDGKITVSGQSRGMVYCKKGENITNTFYPFADYMPVRARFDYPPRNLFMK